MAQASGGRTVKNVNELQDALKAAKSGHVIVLAPGIYPAFSIHNLSFDEPVILTGAGAILQGVTVFGCTGLGFQGLSFQGDPDRLADGLLIRQSKRISVEGCEFQKLMYGIGHLNSADLRVEKNRFLNLRSDGMRGGGSSRLSIIGNHFTNFHPKMQADGRGDHPDAIQFWTVNTTTSAEDILVQNNLVERGDGLTIQGVFLGDDHHGKLPYIRPKLLDNVIVGGAWNGVTIGGGVDIEVARNVCLAFPDQGCRVRVQNVATGVVSDNQASDFVFDNMGKVKLTRNVRLAPARDRGVAFMRAREKI